MAREQKELRFGIKRRREESMEKVNGIGGLFFGSKEQPSNPIDFLHRFLASSFNTESEFLLFPCHPELNGLWGRPALCLVLFRFRLALVEGKATAAGVCGSGRTASQRHCIGRTASHSAFPCSSRLNKAPSRLCWWHRQ